MTTRQDVIKQLDALPAEGPFSRSSINVRVVERGGLYHSPYECPESPEAAGPRVLSLVPIERAISGHHEGCLTDSFFLHWNVLLEGSDVQVSIETMTHSRAKTLDVLQRLKAAPGSLHEALFRLSAPFSVWNEGHSVRVGEKMLYLTNWNSDYVKEYLGSMEATHQYLRAVAPDVFNILTDPCAAGLTLERKFELASSDDQPNLVHKSHSLSSTFDQFADPDLPRINFPLEVISTLFGVGQHGDLLLVPSSFLEAFRIPDGQRALLNSAPTQETIEAVEVLFDPDGEGVYSSLPAAFEAATRL